MKINLGIHRTNLRYSTLGYDSKNNSNDSHNQMQRTLNLGKTYIHLTTTQNKRKRIVMRVR